VKGTVSVVADSGDQRLDLARRPAAIGGAFAASSHTMFARSLSRAEYRPYPLSLSGPLRRALGVPALVAAEVAG